MNIGNTLEKTKYNYAKHKNINPPDLRFNKNIQIKKQIAIFRANFCSGAD